MKTHQEIHDAIQTTQVEATASTLNRILDILHALNDRIEELEKRLVQDDGSAASDERLRH